MPAEHRFVYTRPDDPRARPLVDELSREYDERYGLNSSAELSRYPAELFTPAQGGAFVLVLRGDEVVGGGAFKRVDEGTMEIKRVWTSSAHRRQGLARLVMAELEREASARGYLTAELTTGARQPEAVALYLSLGYAPLYDTAGDLETIGYLPFTKPLPAAGERSAG